MGGKVAEAYAGLNDDVRSYTFASGRQRVPCCVAVVIMLVLSAGVFVCCVRFVL